MCRPESVSSHRCCCSWPCRSDRNRSKQRTRPFSWQLTRSSLNQHQQHQRCEAVIVSRSAGHLCLATLASRTHCCLLPQDSLVLELADNEVNRHFRTEQRRLSIQMYGFVTFSCFRLRGASNAHSAFLQLSFTILRGLLERILPVP